MFTIKIGQATLTSALVFVVVAAAAAAAAHTTPTVKTAQNQTLKTKIVVSATGRTLYHLTTEKGKKFICTGSCATIWPPLIIPKGAKPVAGPGVVKSKLGTITRPDGRTQLTYYGMTLYRYSGDGKAGQTKGEGIQKIWYAVSPAGKLVKKASPGGGYGGGYGGGG